MNKLFALFAGGAFAIGGAVGANVLLTGHPPGAATHPVWTEVQWPFPVDQWGRGKAFVCKPTDCGTEITLYLRAKIGFCNCTTGVSDDTELDRMSDFDLVGGDVSALGSGREITVGRMKGRSRTYALRNAKGVTAISAAFNDRCDMVVATAVLQHDRPASIEPGLVEFLNGAVVSRWAEMNLGL